MKRVQNIFSWVAVASEVSHVFCCVLPSVFTLMTVLVSMGMIGVMPLWLDDLHHTMHDYEIPLIAFSAAVLFIGWGLHFISNKIDCHDTGCGHGPCAPKKKKAGKVLKIATILFVINVCIYGGIHYTHKPAEAHAHHEDHGHDH